MRTRAEHLDWCKQRALDYLDRGDLLNAVTSMLSDLDKHPDTRSNNPTLYMLGMIYIRDRDAQGVRRFIEGFR